MAQDSLHILPRCPSCAARLPIGRLLTFDTRQVVPCKQCELQMQIDLRMTVVDWLIQTLIYVPIAVYSLYASIALIQWLEMLQTTVLVSWFLLTVLVGQCVWRIYFPRVTPWEPACLKCGYNLKGLSSESCPECGKGFDLATYNALDPGFRVYAKTVARVTMTLFVLITLFDFLILSVLIPYSQSKFLPIMHVGYPFHIFKSNGNTLITNWTWHWPALVDNLTICLLAACFVSLYLIHRRITAKDSQVSN